MDTALIEIIISGWEGERNRVKGGLLIPHTVAVVVQPRRRSSTRSCHRRTSPAVWPVPLLGSRGYSALALPLPDLALARTSLRLLHPSPPAAVGPRLPPSSLTCGTEGEEKEGIEKEERWESWHVGPRVFLIFYTISLSSSIENYYFNWRGVY